LVGKLLPKYQRNYCLISDLNFFVASWGLPGSFLSFLGDLVSNIINKDEGSLKEAPKSFQEAPRKLQKNSGQKSGNNFVGILEEVFGPKGHSEIN
jgi:hypothetical protein